MGGRGTFNAKNGKAIEVNDQKNNNMEDEEEDEMMMGSRKKEDSMNKG